MKYPVVEGLLFTLYFSLVLVAILLSSFIWKYIDKKPLGMQTLIDPLIKDLIVWSFATLFTSTITTLFIGAPYPGIVAWSIICLLIFSAHSMFASNFSFVLIKYLCIFHPDIQLQENASLNILRSTNFLVSISCLTYEAFDQDLTTVGMYKNLTGSNDDGNVDKIRLNTLKVMGMVNLIAVVFVQLRIEKFKSRDPEAETKLNYSFKTLRKMAAAVVFFMLVILLRLSGFLQLDGSNSIGKLIRAIISVFALFNVLPALVIFNKKNLKAFAIKSMKSLFMRR